MKGGLNSGNTVSIWTASTSSFCDGAFKSNASSPHFPFATENSMGCTLEASKTIVQVFVLNAYKEERFGAVNIMIGENLSSLTNAY